MADSAEPAEAPPADPTVPAADADNAPAADPTTPAAEAPASGQTQDESSDPVGDLFREVDVDGSGELDIGEVRTLCKRLGQKLDNAGIARAFREMDADASGGVDLQVVRLVLELVVGRLPFALLGAAVAALAVCGGGEGGRANASGVPRWDP